MEPDVLDGPGRSDAAARRRMRWSWVLSGLGFALMLGAVLWLSSATVGGRVDRFEKRRTYNEVKRAAHAVYPAVLLTGLSGLALAVVGSRMRTPRV